MRKNQIYKIKVAIVYHYIAHYRKAIFTELCHDQKNIEYNILADEKSNISSIKVLTISETSSGFFIFKKWKKLKNVWITKNILWQKGILNVSFSNDYDAYIFLGNMYFISTWVAVIIVKLRGKRVYFWTHGFRNKEKGFKGWLRVVFYKMADGLFLYGNQAKDILIDKGFLSKKLHVIYNSLDFRSQFRVFNKISDRDKVLLKQQLQIDETNKVIIAIGRITKDKKIDMLVDAIANLNKEEFYKYKLIVVGNGPDKPLIENKAKKLNVQKDVVFFGECYRERQLATLLMISDVSAVPGDIGLSAIHSLTYGTPVITHDDFSTHKPEFEAIEDGVNGSFYKSGSIFDLMAKIRLWCENDNVEIIHNCQAIISDFYNAEYQKSIIDKVIGDDY